jgi:hypothetical protein
MKTIIAGSRDGVTYSDIKEAVASCGWEITEVIEGGARGADAYGGFFGSGSFLAIDDNDEVIAEKLCLIE